jgi:hypothetical protein
MDPDQWVDPETACAMLDIAPRTLRHLAAEDKIMRVVLPGPKQTRVYFKPDIERFWRSARRRHRRARKPASRDALAVLFQLLTQLPEDPPRPALHLALQDAAPYAGLPAPFLLRLVAQCKLACWKTPSESGEGYFFARSDLEALRPGVEGAG